MITRLYLTKWEARLEIPGDEASRFTWHPLLEVGDMLPQVGEPQRVLFKIPTASVDGAPSKLAILVFVSAVDIPDSIAEIEDVYMLPPHVLSQSMDSINDEVKAEVISKLSFFGIAYEDIVGALTVADFIDKVEVSVNVIGKDTAVEFVDREAEFA